MCLYGTYLARRVNSHVWFLLKGLKRSLTSAQAMSKTSIDFFKDIRIHVSRLITLMEQNQMERSSNLVKFENEFKVVDFDICAIHFIYEQTLWWLATLWQETCVKDEQAALNKIAAILSELTAKKTTMVRLYIAWANKMVLVWLQL